MSTYVSLGDPEAERAPDGTILDIAMSCAVDGGAVRVGVYRPGEPPNACVHLTVYGARKIAQRILDAAEWAEAGTVRPPWEGASSARHLHSDGPRAAGPAGATMTARGGSR